MRGAWLPDGIVYLNQSPNESQSLVRFIVRELFPRECHVLEASGVVIAQDRSGKILRRTHMVFFQWYCKDSSGRCIGQYRVDNMYLVDIL